MKRNLFKAVIQSIEYKHETNSNIVKCIIHWYNPILDTKCKSIGTAKCREDDEFDEILGKRIAESRAKMDLYRRMSCSIYQAFNEIGNKHEKLRVIEIDHITDLINKHYGKN